MRRRRRRSESGYALLMVLLMGAIIAISLYREIPRIAFNSQRQKEQLLIERGEQYKRAIQLFVRANQRWPNEIKDLESTNSIRFLRKRFVDPMTGKEEWRLVHIKNGILQDSVTTKDTQGKEATERTDSYVGLVSGIGQAPVQAGAQTANIAMRRRPSDANQPGLGELQPDGQNQEPPQPDQPPVVGPPGILPPGVNPGNLNNGQPVNNGQPLPPGVPTAPMAPGTAPVFAGNPIFTIGRGANPGGLAALPGQNGQTASSPTSGSSQSGSSYMGGGGSYMGGGSYIGAPSTPTNSNNGLPPQPRAPVNSQNGGVSPYPINAGANGTPPNFNQPGLQPGQPGGPVSNPAAQMIGNLLTQPRPGGMPLNTAPGGLIGAGIAGVASNLDSDSIKVYNDRTNYSEWEFLFDPAKEKRVMNPMTGQIGTPVGQSGSTPGARPGSSPTPPAVPSVPGTGATSR